MYGVLVDGYVADGTITQAEADSLSPTQLEFLIRKRSPTAMGGAAGETTAAAGSKSAAASSSSSAASAEETLIITEAEASPALPCCLRWMGALMAGGLGWLHGASCSACRRGSCSSRRWWVLVTAPHHKQPPIVHSHSHAALLAHFPCLAHSPSPLQARVLGYIADGVVSLAEAEDLSMTQIDFLARKRMMGGAEMNGSEGGAANGSATATAAPPATALADSSKVARNSKPASSAFGTTDPPVINGDVDWVSLQAGGGGGGGRLV